MRFFGIVIFKFGLLVRDVGFKIRQLGCKIGKISEPEQKEEDPYRKSPYMTRGTRKCSGPFKRVENEEEPMSAKWR